MYRTNESFQPHDSGEMTDSGIESPTRESSRNKNRQISPSSVAISDAELTDLKEFLKSEMKVSLNEELNRYVSARRADSQAMWTVAKEAISRWMARFEKSVAEKGLTVRVLDDHMWYLRKYKEKYADNALLSEWFQPGMEKLLIEIKERVFQLERQLGVLSVANSSEAKFLSGEFSRNSMILEERETFDEPRAARKDELAQTKRHLEAKEAELQALKDLKASRATLKSKNVVDAETSTDFSMGMLGQLELYVRALTGHCNFIRRELDATTVRMVKLAGGNKDDPAGESLVELNEKLVQQRNEAEELQIKHDRQIKSWTKKWATAEQKMKELNEKLLKQKSEVEELNAKHDQELKSWTRKWTVAEQKAKRLATGEATLKKRITELENEKSGRGRAGARGKNEMKLSKESLKQKEKFKDELESMKVKMESLNELVEKKEQENSLLANEIEKLRNEIKSLQELAAKQSPASSEQSGVTNGVSLESFSQKEEIADPLVEPKMEAAPVASGKLPEDEYIEQWLKEREHEHSQESQVESGLTTATKSENLEQSAGADKSESEEIIKRNNDKYDHTIEADEEADPETDENEKEKTSENENEQNSDQENNENESDPSQPDLDDSAGFVNYETLEKEHDTAWATPKTAQSEAEKDESPAGTAEGTAIVETLDAEDTEKLMPEEEEEGSAGEAENDDIEDEENEDGSDHEADENEQNLPESSGTDQAQPDEEIASKPGTAVSREEGDELSESLQEQKEWERLMAEKVSKLEELRARMSAEIKTRDGKPAKKPILKKRTK